MKAKLQFMAPATILTTAIAPMAWGTTYLVTTELLPAGRPLLAGLLRALPAEIVLAAITRSRPQGTWFAGILGVSGVGLLVLGAEAKSDAVGVFAGLGGAAAMAMGVVLTKRWGRPTSLLALTSWQLIAGGLFLLPLALMVEGVPQNISTANIAGFLWLSSVGTAVAYALWFRGIQILPVAQVTLLGLFSPVIAAIAGWVVIGQSLSLTQFTGMAIVLSSIWIAMFSRGTEKAEKLPSLEKLCC